MTSSLTVIGLITQLRTYDKTVYGEALYREKISSQTHTFSIKQFVNARHHYNDTFNEGDLVLLGGKFTIENKKLMLAVEMAIIMEPRKEYNGKNVPWEPTSIPPSKPFINICTTAYEPVASVDDLNFVKTRSSIYSSFHKNARTINFDIGYSKEARWFETLNDKWNEYSNFHIGGFLEDVYSVKENNSTDAEITYAQIDAKIIDYDTRFRHQKVSTSNTQSISSPKSTNTFAKRRTSTYENQQSLDKLSVTKRPSPTASTTPPISNTYPPYESNNKSIDINSNSSSVDQTHQANKYHRSSNPDNSNDDPIEDDNPIGDDDPIISPRPKRTYKRKATEDPINEDDQTIAPVAVKGNKGRKKSGSKK